MTNENNSSAHSSTIDALARKARTETDPAQKNDQWRELWREVLPLERWYFIKDDSDTLSPIYLKDGDNIILPAFTSVERAVEYAKDFGGADRVYGSAPGGMLSAASELEKNGVGLIVFNAKDEPFAVTPVTLKTLAEGYVESGQGQIVGVNKQLPESEIDALAYYSRANLDDIKAKSALWIESLLLDYWYFVPVGEGEQMRPFAVKGESGAVVLAFTTPKRAAEYGALRGFGDLDAVIQMTPQESITAFTSEGSAAESMQFDPQHGSFFTSVKQLPAMLEIAQKVAAQREESTDEG